MVGEQYTNDRIVALQCEQIKNNKLIKWALGDVFFSYLVIFPATFSPFCQSGPQTTPEMSHYEMSHNEMSHYEMSYYEMSHYEMSHYEMSSV